MQTDAATVTSGDITIDSNHENADQITLAFSEDAAPPSGEVAAPEPAAVVPAEAASADEEKTAPAATAPEDADAVSPSKARRRNPQAAVQSAIAKQREAERRAAVAESQLATLAERTAPTPAAPAVEAAPPTTPDWARFKAMAAAPKADQFENYDDYTAALATFVTDARHHQHETRRQAYYQEQAQQESQHATMARWQERLAQARTDIPDLDATLDPNVPMSSPMQYLAMESPVGIPILQYLSANPQESQRLSTLHPAEVYREMGKLEERLSAAPDASRGPAPAISHAKPPIKPLGSSPHTPDATAITDELSFEEHFKRMNAADRKAGRF
jgi:hypothetical protein